MERQLNEARHAVTINGRRVIIHQAPTPPLIITNIIILRNTINSLLTPAQLITTVEALCHPRMDAYRRAYRSPFKRPP